MNESWWETFLNRLLDNPEVMWVFIFGFGIGAFTEWVLEHVPYWWRSWREHRGLKKRIKRDGPQWFEPGSAKPDGPAPRLPAAQPPIRQRDHTRPITLPREGEWPAAHGATATSVLAAAEPAPETPKRGGRHARPRQRSARFWTRQRRSNG